MTLDPTASLERAPFILKHPTVEKNHKNVHRREQCSTFGTLSQLAAQHTLAQRRPVCG